MDGRIWPQWKEIHPLANVELINAFHKAREYETVLSKIYFTAFLRIEKLLWPSPVTMNVPEKFFHSRGMEIYSMLCGSSNFFSYWLTLSTAWSSRSQGGDWLIALFISADTVYGGTDLFLTHSIKEMVPETSSLLVPLPLQLIRAGRQGSSYAPSLEEIPFLYDSLGWRVNGVISSPAPPIPTRPMWLHSRIHDNIYKVFPWKPLLKVGKMKLDWIN